MKHLRFYFCIISLVMITSSVFANSTPSDEDDYRMVMEQTLARLDTVKSAGDLLQCRNAFERISAKYPNQWLPTYYTAYTGIEAIYYNREGKNNNAILQNTKLLLDKLSNFADADKSEESTLWGYYYMAVIMMNPQVNGQKYSGEVIRFFIQAKELNADNPRPVFLLAFFEQMLPSFLKSKMDYCEEMEKAGALYDKQEKAWNKPYWGEGFYSRVSAKCNNN